MKKIISLQLEEELITKLKQLCKVQDRSMSALCRLAIMQYINLCEEDN